MGLIDQVTKLRNQGIEDVEIASRLKEQGFPPKTITDALTQADIKSAVSKDFNDDYSQPSMMEQEEIAPSPRQQMSYPATKEYGEEPEDTYTPTQQDTYQPQSSYQGYDEFYPQETGYSGSDADTMIEISQQVFSEKIKNVQKALEDLTELITIYKTKTDDLHERLRRMETMFDKMQLTIIDKVGNYGKDLSNVKKEVGMIQESFSKIANPLLDKRNQNQQQRIVQKPKPLPTTNTKLEVPIKSNNNSKKSTVKKYSSKSKY